MESQQPTDRFNIESIEQSVANLEKQLGIGAGFLRSLTRSTDWAFVVQTSAFMEAGVSHLVVEALGRPELAEVLACTDMAHSKAGKIRIARSLDLLDKTEARFLRALAELRNELVHDVKQVNFSLADWVATKDATQLRRFATDFNAFAPDLEDSSPAGTNVPMAEYFRRKPQEAIWRSAMSVANSIHSRVSVAKVDHGINKLSASVATALMEKAGDLLQGAAKRRKLSEGPLGAEHDEPSSR